MVALLDFGGGGTSITLADAASAFEPIEDTTRYTEFSGDQIDQALLNHVLDGIANAGGVDPAGTAAVGSLTRLREECRNAKERLSTETVHRTDRGTARIPLRGPGHPRRVGKPDRAAAGRGAHRTGKCVGAQQDQLAERLCGGHHRWRCQHSTDHSRLSEHSQAPVMTTPQPALDAAVGAALFAAYGAEADAKTGVAPVLPVDVPDPLDAPESATFRALAWSQDDDTADDVVPYTGDVYDTGVTDARPQVQYVPPTEPIEEPRTTWQRLPQLVFGIAAVVAVVAVGGVAVALTSCDRQHQGHGTAADRHVGSRAHQRGTAAVDARHLSRPSR